MSITGNRKLYQTPVTRISATPEFAIGEEREEFERWGQSGWVDTFRHFEPNPHHYTWWSQRFGVRERNIGWRIDYILASQNLLPSIQSVSILPNVTGSDLCTVHIEMD